MIFDGVAVGTMTNVTRADNFKEIDNIADAYRILDGDDILTGAIGKPDVLTGGFGGNDNFVGFGGNDKFIVGTVNNTKPTHVFTGATGSFDIVAVVQNIHDPNARDLDLTLASFSGIEELTLDSGTSIRIDAKEFGPGIVGDGFITGGVDSSLTVQMFAPGTLDLHDLRVTGAKVILVGSSGADTITGTATDETIRGGLGGDRLTAGTGKDTFDFDGVKEIGKKKGKLDLITDWSDGDKIDLSTIDANGKKKGDKAFKFLKKEGADFTKAGQVGFDQKKGKTVVQGDTNGDGKADFKLQLAGDIDLAKGDFVL